MFKKKSLYALSFIVILALVLAACAPASTPEPTPVPTEEPTEEVEVEPEPQSIVDIAVADGRFSTLVSALQAADLAGTLAGEGPFTVFAPTDEAFAKLPEGTLEALLEDIPALTDILLYHVVSGEVLAEDVVNLESAQTLLGENLGIKVENGVVYLNDAQVVITDIMADNGVIHVIDSVLLPPEPLGNIVEIAIEDGRFSTLVSALQAADLVGTLAGEGPFTVFAPTDEAFAKLPEGTLEALLEDIPALTDILLYHVVSGQVLAEDVVALESAESLLGQPIRIKVEDGMVYLNENVQVVITDIVADNGVIHVIDSVLLPPEPLGSIVEIAIEDGRFTTLVNALQAADLVGTLAGEGPFTVFAPTDEAFAKLSEGTLESLLEDIPALTDILLYHVVSGEFLAEDVIMLDEAETLLGEPIRIKVEDGMVYLNEDVQVVITDIIANNGVIHVIDSVLIPPEN
jgi:transforming growth factor-beta-induced protein